jgi:hypothetical protein
VADFNLKKETLGKVPIFCDSKAKYHVSVSYDMGWQKSARTYDSLSGHGLMIGNRTKHVICYKTFLKSCGVCQRHAKKIDANKTPNLPVRDPNCSKNCEGSSKGMEARAALECVFKVWTHSEISAFIDILCIDDDASTKAYLSRTFKELNQLNLPQPTNRKGQPKTAQKDNKGKLPPDHLIINFLANLCHQVWRFGKYLWALKVGGKKKSKMNLVDCLRLKRNYAWCLFSGRRLTYTKFKMSLRSPVLHHFNNRTTCEMWCKHKDKSEK